jgi:ribosomal-protein-alanine N-acetyltransferase
VIRRADPGDEPTLRTLQSHLPHRSPRLLEAALDSADARGVPAPAHALVSTGDDDDVPVGYLLAAPGDGTTYVAELVVAPDHRREGRARALLDACDGRLTVTVDPDDEVARSLYRDCGFEYVRRLPDFFDGDPAVLLSRG